LPAWLILFGAAVLTVVIETPILWLTGYRSRRFVLVCVLISLVTNLTLNLCMSFAGGLYDALIYPAEVAVVLVEWAVLRQVAADGAPVPWLGRESARLFAFVLLANAASFLVGVMIWGL